MNNILLWIILSEIIQHFLTLPKVNTVVIIIWQYGLWSFQTGYKKLERFLPKNQHTQRKFLNFEDWTKGEPQ